jgi:ATP-dependent DNA ligase
MTVYRSTLHEVIEDKGWVVDVVDIDLESDYIIHDYGDTIDIYGPIEDGYQTTLNFVVDSEVSVESEDTDSYILPALYGVDKKGKERIWKTWVVKNIVYKSYGEVGGVLSPSSRVYKGVNEGKKNSTTAHEQAMREAERDWVKQLDKEYRPKSKEGIALAKKALKVKNSQGGVNVNVDLIFREAESKPKAKAKKGKSKSIKVTDDNGTLKGYENTIRTMQCEKWTEEDKCTSKFDFDNGVYIQPKLDGIRCLAMIVKDDEGGSRVVLLSRNGKQFVWLKHIRQEVLEFLDGHEDMILDGEVYANVIYGDEGSELPVEQKFDVISGAVRPKRNDPHPLEAQLSLYVFDIADPTSELSQDERFEILKELFASGGTDHIKMVETKVIYYPEEIYDYHDEVADRGYEGVVIRSADLTYEPHRKSLYMRKYKNFIDEEYSIVDAVCDEGVDREYFTWVCEKTTISPMTDDAELKTFTVKPMGTREQRQDMYDNKDEYIGKLLTVRYQVLTYEGVPRFPRGVSIRDYE